MVTQELIDYIKYELARGTKRDEIFRKLTVVGWEKADVENGFKEASEAPASTKPLLESFAYSVPADVVEHDITEKDLSAAKKKRRGSAHVLFFIFLLFVIVLGGITWFFYTNGALPPAVEKILQELFTLLQNSIN